MNIRSGLSIALSAGIAFSLMIGVSGCSLTSSDDQTAASNIDEQQQSTIEQTTYEEGTSVTENTSETGTDETITYSTTTSSSGLIEIPDLVGMYWEDAKEVVISLGLVWQREADPSMDYPSGYVVATDLAPGTLVAPGTRLVVFESSTEEWVIDFGYEAPGMTEEDVIRIISNNGYNPVHGERFDDYSDDIAEGLVLTIQRAPDAMVIYYGLSKGSASERLAAIYADYDAFTAETIASLNDQYQQNPWYNEYWTITDISMDINTFDLYATYPNDYLCYYTTPEGYTTYETEIVGETLQYGVQYSPTGRAGTVTQWCMQRTDSEGTDYLRSTAYVEGYGVVDIAYYGIDYSQCWYICDTGQPIGWRIDLGWYVPDDFIDAEPWSQWHSAG